MKVRDLMTRVVVTVGPEDGVDRAAELLAEHDIHTLPVVDAAGHVLGMVTEADVVRDAVPRDPWARDLHPSVESPHPARVGDVMSFHPVALLPGVDLPIAADLLVNSSLTCLPVVEGGVLVGILTRHDLVAALAHTETHHRQFRSEETP